MIGKAESDPKVAKLSSSVWPALQLKYPDRAHSHQPFHNYIIDQCTQMDKEVKKGETSTEDKSCIASPSTAYLNFFKEDSRVWFKDGTNASLMMETKRYQHVQFQRPISVNKKLMDTFHLVVSKKFVSIKIKKAFKTCMNWTPIVTYINVTYSFWLLTEIIFITMIQLGLWPGGVSEAVTFLLKQLCMHSVK